jgi:hypothetical protein
MTTLRNERVDQDFRAVYYFEFQSNPSKHVTQYILGKNPHTSCKSNQRVVTARMVSQMMCKASDKELFFAYSMW